MIYHDYAFMPSIYQNDQIKIGLIYFSVVVYLMMYGLQLFWFSKIVVGLLKALGVGDLFLNKGK